MSDVPKILIVSAAANMIQQFNRRNILILKDLGYDVHVATNFVNYGSMSSGENEKLKMWLTEQDVTMHQVNFMRGMGNPKTNWLVYKDLCAIIKQNGISIIHAHSPIGGVIGRLAAKREHIKSIYTAHGFHFFKGSPFKNWLLFYPLEWTLSFITDTLIVINKEDLQVTKKFHAKKVQYVPGVGVDVKSALAVPDIEKEKIRCHKREELNLSDEDIVILSVGELSKRKNHQVILRAIAKLNNPKIKLLIAGVGPLENQLRDLSRNLKVDKQLRLLGYRNDLKELHYACDINVFPSLQEGLALGGLESVIDGLYILGADIRGIKDYIIENKSGNLFSPTDVDNLSSLINKYTNNYFRVDAKKYGNFLMKFDCNRVDMKMKKIYSKYKE
ncbi:glycosyltransferase [Leuconostoc mesenteroides]|uniref:Glycosyltransferase n=1 Tax=Leuconostoc mesenteroides subsp. mesenteroides (strain ATCC 8293 / DSM 20343 / BCRC 11652 / CCM 1803 / JCM 6124 / NCDO 523 / NBRC 100496 / NCIMB 8023 / NCTC 12954 / NRRL B-1118 / 37Y) TaxID=203120 RepID=Q03W97_LEUMM|nr:glycosyltransferase [Leuconostoc mesenteroides]ABJ62525.1 Glycosyltransferase [Leuconostoc mesenteroides subsp. mesenteroides ATCC 8293]MDG9746531.1 glycosyltransferase [Leuconostoc mesenteroides]GEL84082.1 putative glycosyltransferase EpsD [Leuconostoc mesenteroides subsp. mesenteroides]STY37590.1 GDP-mannose-dependent alpha-(1-6)-phosphatidylinositol monomannoside mannosyltransferase [Leuconostoc mesenteroides]